MTVKGSYKNKIKDGKVLVNTWFTKNETQKLDAYIRKIEEEVFESTGVKVTIGRTNIINSAVMKLIGGQNNEDKIRR